MSREEQVRISPAQAIAARGLQKQWVAAQLGISPSYLSLLLKGSRRWTSDLAGKFPLVVGLASDAICFAATCTAGVHSNGASGVQVAAGAPRSCSEPQDGVLAPSEYSDTCTPSTALQSPETAEAVNATR